MVHLLTIISVLLNTHHCQAAAIEMYAKNVLQVKVTITILDQPKCYKDDGFLHMREEIGVGGELETRSEPMVPVEFYLELENKTLRLVCVIDYTTSPCTNSGCKWVAMTKRHFIFKVQLLATEAMNKANIVATTRAFDRLWYTVLKNIKVLPAPELHVHVGAKKVYNLRPCLPAVKVNSDFTVKFCVMNLRGKVYVAVDTLEVPLVFKHQENCLTKDFKMGTENMTLQLSYRGGCEQHGSVLCTIIAGELTTTTENTLRIATTVASAPEDSSMNLTFWLIIALSALAVVAFLIYMFFCKKPQKKIKEHKKSLGGMSKPTDESSSTESY